MRLWLALITLLVSAVLMGCTQVQQAEGQQETQPTVTPTETPEVYSELGNISEELQEIEQLLKELEELENVSFES
ncbi:MAG: hypothetical protein H0Z19_07570 [Archaeoglobus sp.]|uniref:hypothetical protein n=1 Tax=Archaeoglobus sp. TaxID=1872626 RepID=UPI001D4853D8|nr:hypothetical protein [Archaeoglobus sp.]MBO8180322.1 hypothetical protein [Archaeoglobus sp.]